MVLPPPSAGDNSAAIREEEAPDLLGPFRLCIKGPATEDFPWDLKKLSQALEVLNPLFTVASCVFSRSHCMHKPTVPTTFSPSFFLRQSAVNHLGPFSPGGPEAEGGKEREEKQ